MKRLLVLFGGLAFIFMALGVNAQSSPLPMLEQVSNKIINDLAINKGELKKNPQIVQKAVKKYFVPHVDVYGMSRSVLGRKAWRSASKSERRQFAEEFTHLVIRTYASPLSEYTDEKVKLLPLRGGYQKRFVNVNSVIIRKSASNIPLSYSLIYKRGQWKIYDLSIEGVSLLQSFRSQFAQQLQSGSIKDLIKRLKQHNKERVG
jgi:phospholipid transport system substrate-binding protein